LNQFHKSLPPLDEISLSVEDQGRGVLRLLIFTPEDAPSTPADVHLCPNCDRPAPNPASPYCSETCRDQAALVRQFRAAIASETILTADKQTVFGERLWWLLGGRLPIRESRIPESAKRQVIKRCGGNCEICGAPMTTIENFGSGCNRPLHLRAVCADCSKTKSFGDPEFIRQPAVIQLLTELNQRIFAQAPVRPCDDPIKWDWRA
jgi:hypothetical protein